MAIKTGKVIVVVLLAVRYESVLLTAMDRLVPNKGPLSLAKSARPLSMGNAAWCHLITYIHIQLIEVIWFR